MVLLKLQIFTLQTNLKAINITFNLDSENKKERIEVIN